MGTTMSALLVRGEYAITAQVGDSRIYLVRDGSAEQVTEDHTLVAWQVKKGLITPDEARHSRQKNVITRAVGSREYVQVDTRTLAVREHDFQSVLTRRQIVRHERRAVALRHTLLDTIDQQMKVDTVGAQR